MTAGTIKSLMQKGLGMLGIHGKADGSKTNPFFVVSADGSFAGNPGGLFTGGGKVGSLFNGGGIFGPQDKGDGMAGAGGGIFSGAGGGAAGPGGFQGFIRRALGINSGGQQAGGLLKALSGGAGGSGIGAMDMSAEIGRASC